MVRRPDLNVSAGGESGVDIPDVEEYRLGVSGAGVVGFDASKLAEMNTSAATHPTSALKLSVKPAASSG